MLKPMNLAKLFCQLTLWAAGSTGAFQEDSGRLKEPGGGLLLQGSTGSPT